MYKPAAAYYGGTIEPLRRRQWHSSPVLLAGKSHGWRSLEGCSPWGHWGLDMTERLHFHFSLSCIGEGNGNPLQCSCLENPRDRGTWRAAVYGVAQSQTRLKWLSNRTLIFTIQRNFLLVKKHLLCISFLSLFFPYIFFFFINCSPTIPKIYPILSDFLCNYITFIIMLKFHWGITP